MNARIEIAEQGNTSLALIRVIIQIGRGDSGADKASKATLEIKRNSNSSMWKGASWVERDKGYVSSIRVPSKYAENAANIAREALVSMGIADVSIDRRAIPKAKQGLAEARAAKEKAEAALARLRCAVETPDRAIALLTREHLTHHLTKIGFVLTRNSMGVDTWERVAKGTERFRVVYLSQGTLRMSWVERMAASIGRPTASLLADLLEVAELDHA